MGIHKEGNKIIPIFGLILATINVGSFFLFSNLLIIFFILLVASLVFYFLVIWFFRKPKREIKCNENTIVCPADGKVVVIEDTIEHEYFKEKRKQISIFMSPLNVHINWYPVSGEVVYQKHHHGKYLVAWHPKSSFENERSTTVIRKTDGTEILVRQIAGAVARRIVTYAKLNDNAEYNSQLGFIKFGSRVDLFLPVDSTVNVKIGDKVKGNVNIISHYD